eukprot:7035551-Alexandrium_andersonii.AAC.1
MSPLVRRGLVGLAFDVKRGWPGQTEPDHTTPHQTRPDQTREGRSGRLLLHRDLGHSTMATMLEHLASHSLFAGLPCSVRQATGQREDTCCCRLRVVASRYTEPPSAIDRCWSWPREWRASCGGGL